MSDIKEKQAANLGHSSFVMYLKPGCEKKYREQHDNIWPALIMLLKGYGISNYHIALHPQSYQLFASFDYDQRYDSKALANEPIMQQWWLQMRELMLTNSDASIPIIRTDAIPVRAVDSIDLAPLTTNLQAVFYMP